MNAIMRFVRLIGFTLLEYVRSGRILVEVIAALAFFFIFLRASTQEIDAHYFFTVNGIFTLGLTLYTTSAMLNMGDRPQGYMLLSRRSGRTSYLLGFYLSAQLIVMGIYALLSLATALTYQLSGSSFSLWQALGEWMQGTPPMILNAGLLGALLLILSPMVFSAGWRLFVLALIALAFSSNFIPGPILDVLPDTVTGLLTGLQTILSWPLVPAFRGFALALSRDYSGSALIILIAQISLLVALLGLAIYAFAQRDLVLNRQ